MRVLLVSHSPGGGGAELALVESVAALGRLGVDVHVALPDAGPLEERLASLGATTSVAPRPWAWWVADDRAGMAPRARARLDLLRGSRGSVEHLRGRIRDVGPDVVVTNTSTFPQGAIAATLARVPHVWHVHEFGREDLGLRNLLGDGMGIHVMGALSSRVVACSGAVAAKLARHVSPEKIRVVYGAPEIDPPGPAEAAPLPDVPLRLLTLGRLHPGKGHQDAIRATAILSERGLDVELRVVGGGPRSPRRASLEQLASRSAARGRVVFRPETATPGSELGQCHVFLMTSQIEAFGRVTIEAMKAGRPVVATASGGTLELVRDGWNGLLYRPGNAEHLARQIARLHEDRALRAGLAARGREWARERFTLDRYGADLRQVLAEAAGSAGI